MLDVSLEAVFLKAFCLIHQRISDLGEAPPIRLSLNLPIQNLQDGSFSFKELSKVKFIIAPSNDGVGKCCIQFEKDRSKSWETRVWNVKILMAFLMRQSLHWGRQLFISSVDM